jgi:hypothetical protein
MPLIFVNYRTGDEEATATLVERELSRVFGDTNVFRASKSISPGQRFPLEIRRAVRRSSVLLAVIGERWLRTGPGGGRTALEDPDDWVRREIAEAFDTGVLVVPLLVGRAGRLGYEDLPDELAELADCQYVRFDHRNADSDLSRLAARLTDALPELAEAARRHGHDPAAGPAPATNAAGRNPDEARERPLVVNERQRGGIGMVGGDFSGTWVSDPSGPVHTGSGHLYHGAPPAPGRHEGPYPGGQR